MIQNYDDFCRELLHAGFSLACGSEGVFGLLGFGWLDQPPESPVRWHTGDPETDPWQWRVRVLAERRDIAYGKVFLRKAGYIAREWYPYFLAARREGRSFGEAYAGGLCSQYAKRIFETLSAHGALPAHEIKKAAGFGKEENSRFEKALTDLQMGLFITMCGQAQKRAKSGEGYGWASMMFCVTEEFWGPAGPELFEQAAGISRAEAVEAITERIYGLNPKADARQVEKFVLGR